MYGNLYEGEGRWVSGGGRGLESDSDEEEKAPPDTTLVTAVTLRPSAGVRGRTLVVSASPHDRGGGGAGSGSSGPGMGIGVVLNIRHRPHTAHTASGIMGPPRKSSQDDGGGGVYVFEDRCGTRGVKVKHVPSVRRQRPAPPPPPDPGPHMYTKPSSRAGHAHARRDAGAVVNSDP
jgi:hypothetical protein